MHVHAGGITFAVPGRAGGDGCQEEDGPGLLYPCDTSLAQQGKVEMRGEMLEHGHVSGFQRKLAFEAQIIRSSDRYL